MQVDVLRRPACTSHCGLSQARTSEYCIAAFVGIQKRKELERQPVINSTRLGWLICGVMKPAIAFARGCDRRIRNAKLQSIEQVVSLGTEV
jgi:hypothetical protein